jgi:hypothetical protein
MNRKALPSRPSQDSGYGQMRQSPPRSNGSSVSGFAPPQLKMQTQTQFLNGKTLLEGYRKDIITNFEEERPRYNPVRAGSGEAGS